MTSVLPKTSPASFFMPIGVGVLLQMACVGLVMAITVIASAPPRSESAPTEVAGSQTELEAATPQTPPAPAQADSPPKLAAADDVTSDVEPKGDVPSPQDVAAATDEPNKDPAKAENPAQAMAPEDNAANAIAKPMPLDDVRARSRVLKIAGEEVAQEVALCRIDVSDPATVQLTLLDTEFPRLTMELEKLVDAKVCRWSVRQVAALGFDRVQPVGEFQLEGQQLTFRWHKGADKGKLPFCRLKITAEDDSEVCNLWSPVQAAAIRINLEAKASEFALFVPPGIQLPPPESMRLDFSLHDWPENEQDGSELLVGQNAEIRMSDADYDEVLLRIQLALRHEEGQLKVQSSWFTTIPKMSARRGSNEVTYIEQPLKRTDLDKLVKEMNSVAARWQKEMDDIDKELERTEKQLDSVKDMLIQVFRPELSEKKDQLTQRCTELEDQKAAAGEIHETFSKAHTAMQKLATLCTTVEKNGRVEFRLVRPLERGATHLVISSSVKTDEDIKPP